MIHELKIYPEYFQSVDAGTKKFELRKNDRDFKCGDILLLREYEPDTQSYTGDFLLAEVTYLLDDFPGIEMGYCVMSIRVLK